MAAGVEDITIEAGATFRMTLTWSEPDIDADTPGEPYDLTGAIARMQIRVAPGKPVLLDLRDNDGITLGDRGLISIAITAAQTWAVGQAAKRAKYDLFVTLSGGDREKVLKGQVTVDKAITELDEVAA